MTGHEIFQTMRRVLHHNARMDSKQLATLLHSGPEDQVIEGQHSVSIVDGKICGLPLDVCFMKDPQSTIFFVPRDKAISAAVFTDQLVGVPKREIRPSYIQGGSCVEFEEDDLTFCIGINADENSILFLSCRKATRAAVNQAS